MKNVLLFAFFLCSSLLLAQSSVLTPPENVTIAFKKQYPKKVASWSVEYDKSDDIKFEAEFNVASNIKAFALYWSDGVFISYKVQIPKTKLPLKAQNYLAKNYAVKTIIQNYLVLDDKNEETFETGIKISKQLYKVVFNKEGEGIAKIRVKFI